MMRPLATCVKSAGVRTGDIPVEYFRTQSLYILKVVMVCCGVQPSDVV
jgi:NADH:ubiquinone oxidoreductase subunit B-like Fe-S oxidoreductase